MALNKPPHLQSLLRLAAAVDKPTAIVLAGHNGSGKSTLWYDSLTVNLQMPLVNADRLTLKRFPRVRAANKRTPRPAR